MHPSWRIPEEIEKPFRDALDHAAKRRVSELHGMLEGLTEEHLAGAVGLCGFVAAYIAIDVVERRWPTDAQLRRMAQGTVEGGTSFEEFGVTEQNVYLFLSQSALGFKPYAEVFGDIFDDRTNSSPRRFSSPLTCSPPSFRRDRPSGSSLS